MVGEEPAGSTLVTENPTIGYKVRFVQPNLWSPF